MLLTRWVFEKEYHSSAELLDQVMRYGLSLRYTNYDSV